jgi:hypothetical protein
MAVRPAFDGNSFLLSRRRILATELIKETRRFGYEPSVLDKGLRLGDRKSPLGLGHVLNISINGFGNWRAHTKGLVGSNVIILPEPLIDDDLRLIGG